MAEAGQVRPGGANAPPYMRTRAAVTYALQSKPAAAAARGSTAFDSIVKQAAAAREANRLDDAIALYTRANVALGFRIAQDPETPRWKPGNFFGETFAR